MDFGKFLSTPGRRQLKTLILWMNAEQKSFETEFSISVCRPTGGKWKSKTLFQVTFDPRLSIVKSIFDCRLSGVFSVYSKWSKLKGNSTLKLYISEL